MKEKTSRGTLIECYKQGYDLNITKLVCDRFDEIWDRARPVEQGKVVTLLKSKLLWLHIMLIGSLLISNIVTEGVIYAITSNLFAIILGVYIVEMGKVISQKYRKMSLLLKKIKEN